VVVFVLHRRTPVLAVYNSLCSERKVQRPQFKTISLLITFPLMILVTLTDFRSSSNNGCLPSVITCVGVVGCKIRSLFLRVFQYTSPASIVPHLVFILELRPSWCAFATHPQTQTFRPLSFSPHVFFVTSSRYCFLPRSRHLRDPFLLPQTR